jgi:hypothetical protein
MIEKNVMHLEIISVKSDDVIYNLKIMNVLERATVR